MPALMCRFAVGGIMEQEMGRIAPSICCIGLEWRDLREFGSSEELFQRVRLMSRCSFMNITEH